MNEIFAETATGPPATKHGDIPIQALMTYPTHFWLNSQQQGMPLSTSISNAHSEKVY